MTTAAALIAPGNTPQTARPTVAVRAWRALFVCWLGLVAMPATAASWLCWYDADVSVLCRALPNPLPEAAVASGAPGDVRAPADEPVRTDRLPPIARQLWYHPADLDGKQVRIPLFSEPLDMGFVRELAESVMCGSVAACEVRFLESRGELALLLDELEDAS